MLLLASVLTGGAGSPLVALLLLPLLLLLRYASPRSILFAPFACALLLIATSALRAGIDTRATVGAISVVAITLPAWSWRREHRRAAARLTRLDNIQARAALVENAALHVAADELDDVERALSSLLLPLGATAATIWAVDEHGEQARPYATTTFALAPVRLLGDPLGWAWQQGMRLRLDPKPSWATQANVVVAERLRRTPEGGELVSYSFATDHPMPTDAQLDQAAVYLRGVLALHEARAAAQTGERRVAALLSGLKRIPGELELAPLARDLCDTAVAVTGATGAAVGVWDGEQGQLLAANGSDGGPEAGATFALPESELALAIRAEVMIVRDHRDWSIGRTCLAHKNERWSHRPRSLAALPLRGAGGAIGVLAVWSSRAAPLDPDSLELLHLISPYAALHLEHARAFRQLRETAARDPLTQLRNRRAFDESVAAEVVRFERYGRSLALMILDVDHFKSVNDRFGHEAGDEVLRRVARLIAAGVRDTDTAARLGGEEFVVLLPETSLGAAAAVAERIRAAVAGLRVDWQGTSIPVRISIGVSAAPERVAHPGELVRSADVALYRAKQEGRDRVVIA